MHRICIHKHIFDIFENIWIVYNTSPWNTLFTLCSFSIYSLQFNISSLCGAHEIGQLYDMLGNFFEALRSEGILRYATPCPTHSLQTNKTTASFFEDGKYRHVIWCNIQRHRCKCTPRDTVHSNAKRAPFTSAPVWSKSLADTKHLGFAIVLHHL